MDRKRFIRSCAVLAAGTPLAGTFLTGCTPLQYYAAAGFSGRQMTVRKSEFVYEKKNEKAFRRFVLVRVPSLEFPVCIYRNGENNYSASYMQCTHRGCEVKAQPDFLVCPCHGSEFSPAGVVINGPADRDLEKFEITVDDEFLYVHI